MRKGNNKRNWNASLENLNNCAKFEMWEFDYWKRKSIEIMQLENQWKEENNKKHTKTKRKAGRIDWSIKTEILMTEEEKILLQWKDENTKG